MAGSSDIKVVTLSGYNTPKIIEEKSKDYVSYGENNDYYSFLLGVYRDSPTLNAVVNSISTLMLGSGIDAKDKARKPDEWAQLLSLVSDDELEKVCVDVKLLGNGAFQFIYNDDRTKILAIEHFPVQTLRAAKSNEEGEVEKYFYHPDWANKKPNDVLEEFPSFGFGAKSDKIEIAFIKPYKSGSFYYSTVDYHGCIPYCEIEAELANYHINNVKNGFSPSFFINFNNGDPDDETKRQIESDIIKKWGGTSNAGKVIIAFNDDKESAATVDAIQVSDAHSRYEFISNEARNKILIGNRVTSPMLLGIKDNTGLGNNADELKTASMLFDATVLNPLRKPILDSIRKAMAFNKISLNIFFGSLDPFKEESGAEQSQLSSQIPEASDEDLNNSADWLIENGEDVSEEWEEVSSTEIIDGGKEDSFLDGLKAISETINQEEASVLSRLAKSFKSSPSNASEQDTSLFKVRYRYSPEATKENSREFCKKMVSASKVYRKEDIISAGSQVVNAGLGKGGSDTYSIWLYKGGARCHHFWQRVVYMKKNNKKLTVNQARKMINAIDPSDRSEARWEENDKKVAQRPVDMPNNGFAS